MIGISLADGYQNATDLAGNPPKFITMLPEIVSLDLQDLILDLVAQRGRHLPLDWGWRDTFSIGKVSA
jgi:hypothetical protein